MTHTILENPRIDDMYADGWKIYGSCKRNDLDRQLDDLPPWFDVFLAPWMQGFIEIWIKD